MAYTITLTSSSQTINRELDAVQLAIVFTVQGVSANLSYTMQEKGVRVGDWGGTDQSYDFEDAFMVPSIYRFKLFDKDGYLEDLLFGFAYTVAVAKNPMILLTLNGNTEFYGRVQEDSIEYNTAERSVSMTADPDILVLNKQELFDVDGVTELNPFSYSTGQFYPLTQILEDIYGLVDPTISYSGGTLSITHDWEFYGERYSPVADAHVYTDLMLSELTMQTDFLYFTPAMGLNTVGDILRKLALDWGAFTGMIHHGKAFFRKLFYYDGTDLQTLGTVKSRMLRYRYGLIDYTTVTVNKDLSSTLTYTAGTNTHIAERRIERDALPVFWHGHAGPYPSTTNIRATTTRGSYPGSYDVYEVRDTGVGSLWLEYGALLVSFWGYYRGTIQNCRCDKIVASGVDYDFLKNFVDDGRKYQIIGMRKFFGKNETEFDALYLGEV